MKKESKPKVKITIKGSTTGVNAGTSIKQASMIGSTKFVKSKPASKSYSPAPMSAKAKAKAKVAGAKAGPSRITKAVNRAKSVAREVRDIPTAIGTLATVKNKKDVRSAAKENIKMQIKDVAKAVKGGKGNRSAQTVRKGAAIKSVSSYKK
jgi:hypothetical protein